MTDKSKLTCATSIAKSCSSNLNKEVRKIIVKERFGKDLDIFDCNTRNINRVSSFVHYVISKLNNFDYDELNNEIVTNIVEKSYLRNNWGFIYIDYKDLIDGMVYNYMRFSKQYLKNNLNSITEYKFFTHIGECFINVKPDYLDEGILIDYKNYSKENYDYRQLIFYMLCFERPLYGYVNLIKGTFDYIDVYSNLSNVIDIKKRMFNAINKNNEDEIPFDLFYTRTHI